MRERHRIAASRALARWWLGRREMLCAWAHWYRHWTEPVLDAVFLVILWQRRHCAAAADWEARQARKPEGFLDVARREGWL